MKPAVKISKGSGGSKPVVSAVDAFFERSLDRARKLDRGEKLAKEITLRFENPSDMVRVLSTERIKVLKTVSGQPWPISKLALTLKRDRRAVGRDIRILESVGMVQTQEQPNPGHGVIKVVSRRAEKYCLMSTI